MLVAIGYLSFWAVFLCTAASLAAKQYWVLELFSHFVPWYFLLSLQAFLLLLIHGRKLTAFVSFIFMVVHAYTMMPLWIAESRTEYAVEAPAKTFRAGRAVPITVMQFNVNHQNEDHSGKAQWILDHHEDFDVVVLLEVTEEWAETLRELSRQYRYHFMRPVRGYRGIAVFTQLPEAEFDVHTVEGTQVNYVSMRGYTRSGQRMAMYAVHPPPPLNEEKALIRNTVLQQAARAIAKEKGAYKVLVGDFNLTRWSPWFKELKQISGLHDSFDGFGLKSTWPAYVPGPLGLAIDNLLLSAKLRVMSKWVGPNLGSDHLPVVTTFHLE